ncbi:hypothetical protein IMZ08_15340 [Bacillus luteolus]|uniref:Uncharacterized protein n=1 Tax=Litchfieldia luteola TaxID=682179 RepID=A0ABR9QLQ2_9BACI|nr:YheC/YheD family protein [Cytobacillus luteolus]MBE4909425.1 hypothetical protein [Cytobacillus luteolus]MBP1940825.1 hypothetical protein [Cytobacillus luteolus]
MTSEYFKKIEALYEKNHRLNEFLELELEELKKLLTLDSFNQNDIEHFKNIQHSIEHIKNNLLQSDRKNSFSTIKKPISYGMLYPIKKERLFLQLITELQEISLHYEMDIVLFPIEGINLETQSVEGTIISGLKVEKVITNIPKFIYNMTFHSQSSSVKKMRKLRRLENVMVINPINRFNQSILFDMFSSLLSKDQYLLHYDVFSPKTLMEFLNFYKGCLLLPEKGSAKDKVFWVNQQPEKENHYLLSSTDRSTECSEDELFGQIKKRIKSKKYMVIKPISPIKWMDTPLEIRVYVQKNGDGKWSVTDMVGKSEILAKESNVKHIAEKLEWTLQEVSIQKPDNVLQDLTNLSVECCSLMDYYIPNLGTATLDFLVDQDCKPYLLYVKGWETRSYLYTASMIDWKAYLSNAFHYMYYLNNNIED